MRFHLKHCVGGLALVALALPLWAHTGSVPLSLSQPATIEGTQLRAGQYQIKVKQDASEIQVMNSDGKIVAQGPCHWVDLPQKPDNTAVIFQENQITEIDFGGKTQALKLS